VIFTHPQFNQKKADIIASAIGGKVVVIDPLSQDYLENLKKIGQALHASFISEKS